MNERINLHNELQDNERDHPTSSPDVNDERHGVPRIYVASLADYVNGRLHGRWIDATQDASDIEREITNMLAESTLPDAEEWAIHDYDNFGDLNLGEYQSIQTISAIAQGIAKHGEAFACWADLIGVEEAATNPDQFTDAYQGCYESLEEYGSQQWDDFGYTQALEQLPEDVRSYISVNTDMWVRDMRLNGAIDYTPGANGVHVFWEQ